MPWYPHPQTQNTLKNLSDLDSNLYQSYILLDNKARRVPTKLLMYLIIIYLEPRIAEGLKRFTTCSSSILAFFYCSQVCVSWHGAFWLSANNYRLKVQMHLTLAVKSWCCVLGVENTCTNEVLSVCRADLFLAPLVLL